MRYKLIVSILYTLVFIAPATTVNAALVVPTDLNPGDAYHVIFASSTTLKPTSSNIADYDTHVQSAADIAGIGSSIGVNWSAIGSTPTVDAINHIAPLSTLATDVPVYNQNGERIFDSFDDILTTFNMKHIFYNELGNVIDTFVWTGTTSTGVASVYPLGGSVGGRVSIGNTDVSTGFSWIASGSNSLNPHNDFITNSRALYGISSEIYVSAVPAPAAIWLFGSGLISLIGLTKRKA